ncbi:hypothetical protein HU200_011503 [Digitaria exilis]|uniref:Uncharacterized protein n=1 Tax=Digitaria exilis TaxID=1010633 RepID=A0A835FGH1_9POAL|nr:hypothetical protein HU200_011503 [Digitaria exilis]
MRKRKSETNLAVKAWMKALKAAAYQADDVLDDFQYEALRRETVQSMASKKHFELKLCTVYRKNFEANVVVRSVIELATNGRCDLPDNIELLKGRLQEVIGRKSKCKGLPLALNTMGGLLSSKQQVQEWKDIAECNIGDTSRGKDDVVAILKLSYKHLSSEMKQCFAFCAMFPKDYGMEKDKLIQLWMANGFILEEGVMDLTDKGEYIFNELAWRSFLQDVSVNGCKMHDLMHDLATEVTDECASAQDLIQKKVSLMDVHHVQLSSADFEEIGGLLKDTSFLRTLLTQSDHKDLSELKNMRSLRALRCEGSSIIHSQLINTKHLRKYGHNEKAQSYYLLGTDHLKRMPPNLRLLHNLRTLTKFVADARDGCGIEELKDMRQLGNKLQLCNLSRVKSGSEVNLHEKVNLSELDLCWTPGFGYEIMSSVITRSMF